MRVPAQETKVPEGEPMDTLRVITKACQRNFVSFGLGLTLFAAIAPAQSPHFDNGPIWRVTYLRIKPGKVDAFYTDLRQNIRPLYEEMKKQGYYVDYKVYLNQTSSSPTDWGVALAICFKNWGALDQIGTPAQMKLLESTAGPYDKRQAAGAKRLENVDVIRTAIIREAALKPF
jgi:hypothetical protein